MPGLSSANQPLKNRKPVKPPSEGQILSPDLSNPPGDAKPTFSSPDPHIKKIKVRERCSPSNSGTVGRGTLPTPAHPLNRLITRVNERWRVIDDQLQWMLQWQKGKPRKKSSGWVNRSFCRTREGLLRCIREYCGEVDGQVVATLEALPDLHADWERTK